jgi:hypothetical protein
MCIYIGIHVQYLYIYIQKPTHVSRSNLFELEMFQTEFVRRKFILSSITGFSKNVPYMRQCEKISIAGKATDGNMAHAHCILVTSG